MNMGKQGMWTVVLGLFLAVGANAFGNQFQTQVSQEQTAPRVLSASEITTLQDTQFIFIDGTFGDFYKANFKPAIHVLTHEWKSSDYAYITPRTDNDIPTNAEITFQTIVKLRAQSTKKNAVIISHSKGGAETFLMVMHHPELIHSMGVTKILLVSSTLAGTEITNFIEDECGTPSAACTYLHQKMPFLSTFKADVIKPIILDAYSAMTVAEKQAFSSRLYYLRTEMSDLDFKSPLYIPHVYLSMQAGDKMNDGVVPTKSQIFYENGYDESSPVFGTDLGIASGDHNSLFNYAKTSAEENYRDAVFRTAAESILFGAKN
jgi:hypothetical protein